MSEVATITSALAGPGAAMVMLAVVLFGTWKLINQGLTLFSEHLKSIEAKFDSVEKQMGSSGKEVADAVNKLAEINRTLAVEIESVARQTDTRRHVRSTPKEAAQ